MIQVKQNKKCIADIHIEGDEYFIFKIIANFSRDIEEEKIFIDSCKITTTTTMLKELKELKKQ